MTGSVVLASMSLHFVSGINLVLPISINGRKIDGIVDTGAQIAVVSEDCFKNLKLPVGCARFFPLKGAGNTTCIKTVSGDIV
jgi:deoxyhypusine synthase